MTRVTKFVLLIAIVSSVSIADAAGDPPADPTLPHIAPPPSARAALMPASPGYKVIKKIAPGGDGGWDYLTLDPVARRLYISRSNRVMIFDVDRGIVVGEIPNTAGVHGVAIDAKLGRGFTSNGRDSSVTVFDLKTVKPIGRIAVGQGPDSILYDPGSARVFTFNAKSQDATAIDPATQKVVGTVPLGGKPESAVADGKGHVFVNLEDKDELLDVDARKLTVVHRWPVAPGKQPVGLAIDTMRRRLFCTCRNGKMVVVNANDGLVLAAMPIGQHTDACAYDLMTRLVFSSNGDGTLTIVRANPHDDYQVVQTVITQMGARTMALDPMTHNVFLVTAVPKAGERRSYEPGTFVVIVVAMPVKKTKVLGLPAKPLVPFAPSPARLFPSRPSVQPVPGSPTPQPNLPGTPPGQPLSPGTPAPQPFQPGTPPGQPGQPQPSGNSPNPPAQPALPPGQPLPPNQPLQPQPQ
jgi:YVTN family beta-propeller protein